MLLATATCPLLPVPHPRLRVTQRESTEGSLTTRQDPGDPEDHLSKIKQAGGWELSQLSLGIFLHCSFLGRLLLV